ncbi:hypothetical protein HDA32_003961 [Spinactinospora alkalitolerans]|uniref:Uncharacterized protein n=1 Tax=Spinactinospora alkalitolerans TaxID=687207 RepID=A0A852TYH2_9ACTN|nr:hypothetical protein [Spinactinospora alkalitolerans]NYE48841.1 hypothetical protein [Spinactinospora alkalitolerans]
MRSIRARRSRSSSSGVRRATDFFASANAERSAGSRSGAGSQASSTRTP